MVVRKKRRSSAKNRPGRAAKSRKRVEAGGGRGRRRPGGRERSAPRAHRGRQSARHPDVSAALSRAARAPGPGGKPFFDPRRPVAAARAPGRLDVLGGIGDYSGCRVLEWPIAEAAVAMAQPSDDGLIVLRSQDLYARGVAGDPEVHVDL